MNRKELVAAATEVLRENNIRKTVSGGKEKFAVRHDGSGKELTFTVKRDDRHIIYSAQDVENILSVLLHIAEDAVRRGEKIQIYGFGTMDVKKMAARRSKEPNADIWHDIPAGYRPRFHAGKQLLAAAQACAMLEKEDDPNSYLPPAIDDEDI